MLNCVQMMLPSAMMLLRNDVTFGNDVELRSNDALLINCACGALLAANG